MPSISSGKPAVKKCSHCDLQAFRIVKSGTKYCYRHFRIATMRNNAAQKNKSVPPREEIEAMLDRLSDMTCRACKRKMVLHRDHGEPGTVVSLQHWADGTVSLICQSCNSRHAGLGDARFCEVSPDVISCTLCLAVLPVESFSKGNGFKGRQSVCRECGRARHAAYLAANRDRINARKRAHYAAEKTKAKGEGRAG